MEPVYYQVVWGQLIGLVVACLAILLLVRLLRRRRIVAAILVVLALVGGVKLIHQIRSSHLTIVRVDEEPVEVAASEESAPPALTNVPQDAAPAVAAADHPDIPVPAAKGEEPPADQGETTPSEPRPPWVGKPGRLTKGKYEVAVKSGLYVTVAECQRALEAAERAAVADYVESYRGEGAAKLIALGDEYIRSHLEREQFLETVHASIGTMQQLHAQLVIDDDARRDFRDRWRAALVHRRLWLLGGGSTLVLTVLAAAFGYLVASGRRPEPATAAR